jgi:predicted peptidase
LQELIAGDLANYEDVANYIDTDRIYVTGQSLGGAGTLGMAVTYPNFFAAAWATCPLFELSDVQAASLVDMPFRCVHAEWDSVAVTNSINSIAKLKTAGNDDAETLIYPGEKYLYEYAHLSWVPGYQNVELRNWLFAQSK